MVKLKIPFRGHIRLAKLAKVLILTSVNMLAVARQVHVRSFQVAQAEVNHQGVLYYRAPSPLFTYFRITIVVKDRGFHSNNNYIANK
jgi:hypothetical protein